MLLLLIDTYLPLPTWANLCESPTDRHVATAALSAEPLQNIKASSSRKLNHFLDYTTKIITGTLPPTPGFPCHK
ncbi:unnamed protein product [Zymoseptoria tritici ST99CH_3D7]|uniref:Secreted protein n=1 Tax=Zymoseptoria tritici (strain ST99CH_3D7) TaxID=1276538 RepID=A0A1X7SA34_ZYMT9|nr:unnamed protein product [Zymoseptoria tritici ST99CH_3D7]